MQDYLADHVQQSSSCETGGMPFTFRTEHSAFGLGLARKSELGIERVTIEEWFIHSSYASICIPYTSVMTKY
jgi:hypothetical protein